MTEDTLKAFLEWLGSWPRSHDTEAWARCVLMEKIEQEIADKQIPDCADPDRKTKAVGEAWNQWVKRFPAACEGVAE